MNFLRYLFKEHKIALLAFVVAALMAVFFVTNAVMGMRDIKRPIVNQEPLQGWMTPKYVGKSYGLPPDVLGPLLQLEKGGKGVPVTLEDIAARQGRTLAEIEADIRQAADAFQSSKRDKKND